MNYLAKKLIAFSLCLKHDINLSGLLYASVICGGSLLLGAMPMMFELGCEIAYPTSESAANGMFAFFNNLTGVIFMIPFAIPHVGETLLVCVCVFFSLISLSFCLSPSLSLYLSVSLSLPLSLSLSLSLSIYLSISLSFSCPLSLCSPPPPPPPPPPPSLSLSLSFSISFSI